MWGITDLGAAVAFYFNGQLYAVVQKTNIAQAALDGGPGANPSLNRDSITFNFNGNLKPITIKYTDINFFWYNGVVNPFITYATINEFQQAVKSLFAPEQCYACFVLTPVITLAAFDPTTYTIAPSTPGQWVPGVAANCTLIVTGFNEPAPEIIITGSTPALPAGTTVYFFPISPIGATQYFPIVFNDNVTPFAGLYTLNVDVWINGVFQSTTMDFNFV